MSGGVGVDVTGHMEAGGKTVRFYIEMQQEAVRFGFNGRYSELRQLHARLLAVLKGIDKQFELPPFPPKHLLESMHTPANTTRREAELFEYFTLLGTNPLAVDWLAAQHEARLALGPHESEKDGVDFTPPVWLVKKQRSHRSSQRQQH
ncbi:Aste57867_16996 [Aphanomyces stellatus]|uniref:Aste57867_16996 protein n=1 Tax=Aphanomyces stellatus TaxID=120398 RepID=A0A485L7H5_9STRA|nr:hypothetical protein As57867_016938 [Aphanomyces stellatus]VFT93757.1 Aste57867_16996 [Aphanomyces stellatus]